MGVAGSRTFPKDQAEERGRIYFFLGADVALNPEYVFEGQFPKSATPLH